jgi:leucyl/phenylalanyl-tRNA--protein transferase
MTTPAPASAPTPAQRRIAERALQLYREGWFPMHDADARRTEWVQPHERALLPLDERFHVPRTLRARVRAHKFAITSDRAFGEVLRACGDRREGGTWLHDDIAAMFELLHGLGHAHSVEAWLPGPREGEPPVLVGGLYGLALGRVFCGESMFSRPDLGGTDASKVCLVHLVEHLRACGFVMLDAQLDNPHLHQFGLYEVPSEQYLALMRSHAEGPSPWRAILPNA